MERKDLVEASNEYHNSFCDYVKDSGFNAIAKLEAEMKIKWLKLMAERYGVELDI